MRSKLAMVIVLLFVLFSCKRNDLPPIGFDEDAASFKLVDSINIAGTGAAEISAYDPITKRLFVINNAEPVNQVEVVDLSNPQSPQKIHTINIAGYGGYVNSLDVFDGKLAAAIEDKVKQNNGKVVIFNTGNYSEIKVVTVGALPDMVTFTKDGKYILTANEGEPNTDYSNDPAGTISIIDAKSYAVNTIDFSAFAAQSDALKAKGLRIFGVGKDFVKDIEPEYIAVSDDSKTAWVTLQENNAIAKINIPAKMITDIFPLGFKDYNVAENAIDPSDADGGYIAGVWPVKGMYQPDGISVLEVNGAPYLFTANEGDAREYSALTENIRVKNVTLDATAFPNAAELRADAKLGKLYITKTLGDKDGDGDYDELYSFGARSFSVWNGNTGAQLFDSKNDLDKRAATIGLYDNTRSDDKSVEPEGITIGRVGAKIIAFVGLERADAVALYDVTNPIMPTFIKILKTGDAPEGVLFIPADKSPVQKSLLIVSSEGDGMVKIYQPD